MQALVTSLNDLYPKFQLAISIRLVVVELERPHRQAVLKILKLSPRLKKEVQYILDLGIEEDI